MARAASRFIAGGPDADDPDARTGATDGATRTLEHGSLWIALCRCSPISTNSNRARYPVLMTDETSDPQLNGPRASSETSRARRALDPGRRTRL
jgi:hypothetical protein